MVIQGTVLLLFPIDVLAHVRSMCVKQMTQ